MSERLTDVDLREIALRFPTHLGEPKLSVLIQMAVSEIKARRAADLTAEEREALRQLRDWLDNENTRPLALTALDRLLATPPGAQ